MEYSDPARDIPISLPLETYQQLCTASVQSGFKLEMREIGALAVRDWLVRNAPDTFPMPATSGYQWKEVFLPDGTLLRTVFNGKNFHCLVEADEIRFNGAATSPSGFANAVGCGARNAWRVIWILFPNTSVWRRADTLRTRRAVRRPSRAAAAG